MSDTETIIRATHGSQERPLIIGDYQIPCFVLEDGRRVLLQSGLITALDISKGGDGRRSGHRLERFATQQKLADFIPPELIERINHPIKFRMLTSRIGFGYEATVLTDLVKAVLKARDVGKLMKQQTHIAARCEELRDALVGVAIIALVDERTGYQIERDRDELQKILAAYIGPELMPWTKRFPDEFYQQMFRLWNWQYTPLSVKRPRHVGKLTAELVYDKLPPGVIEALREKNPANEEGRRRYRHHQFLTSDIGNPHLEKHLAVLITLMKISPTRRAFERNLARAFPPPIVQGTLFDYDEEEEDDAIA